MKNKTPIITIVLTALFALVGIKASQGCLRVVGALIGRIIALALLVVLFINVDVIFTFSYHRFTDLFIWIGTQISF